MQWYTASLLRSRPYRKAVREASLLNPTQTDLSNYKNLPLPVSRNCRFLDFSAVSSSAAAKGSVPRLLPLEPLRPAAAQAPRGCCTEAVAAVRTRDILTRFQAITRRPSNLAMMPARRAFANPPLLSSLRAVQPSSRARGLASAADQILTDFVEVLWRKLGIKRVILPKSCIHLRKRPIAARHPDVQKPLKGP